MAVNEVLNKLSAYDVYVKSFHTHVYVKVVHKTTNFTIGVNEDSFEKAIQQIIELLDLNNL